MTKMQRFPFTHKLVNAISFFFKGGNNILDTKTLTIQFFTLSDKLVVPNSRERVYFEQQILALLHAHHSQLVSHKICSHFAIS